MPEDVPSRKDLPVQPNGRHVIGLDIGLKNHAAAGLTCNGLPFGRAITFGNDRAGLDRFEEKLALPLGGSKSILIGMEATGHYWMPIYFELKRRGYALVVINPIQTRAKFRSRIRKTKTDPLDALAIARFLLSGEAKAARIPDETILDLRLQARHRWRLVDLASDLKRFAYSLVDRLFPEFHHQFSSPLNATGRALLRELGLAPRRLAEAPERVSKLAWDASRGRVSHTQVVELIQKARSSIGIHQAEDTLVAQLRGTVALIEHLESQVEALEKLLADHPLVAHSPLLSLGLQPAILATLHAESEPLADFPSARQYAAYTGLDPSRYQSGQLSGGGTPISKRGSTYLRRALFLAAMSLYRRKRPFQRLYQKSRRAGHHHTDALVIVAHKLARITWRLLSDNRPFRMDAPRHPPNAKAKSGCP